MKKLLTLILVLSVGFAHAQKSSDKQLAKAIQMFQDATEITGMIASIQVFKEVSDKSPKVWKSAYWTSFVYSQTGRLSENPPAYYDSAQFYLDRVKSIDGLSKSEQSDVHVLQSLIYGLQAGTYWTKGDRENGMKYSNMDSDALGKAIALNKENPRVYLLSGTGIISDGLRNNDPGYLLAGGQMLEIAKSKYEANQSSDKLYPDWGQGWINFWMERAKMDD